MEAAKLGEKALKGISKKISVILFLEIASL
jgi:hypothetical protein